MNSNLKFAFEKETKGAVRYQEVRRGWRASVHAAGWHALRPQERNAGRLDSENTYY
jgi:hypothetical protein